MNIQQKLDRYLNFLHQDPENLNLIIDIVYCYVEMQQFEQAMSYIQQLKSIDPTSSLIPEASIYLHQGDYQRAHQLYKTALDHEESALARYHVGLCCFHLEKFDEALAALKPSIEDNDTQAIMLAARILYHKKQTADALSYVNKILSHHPEHAEALAFNALILMDQNNLDEATNLAQKALNYNSQLYDAQLVVLLSNPDLSATHIDKIESLLAIQPNDSRLWYLHGYALLTHFKFNEAESSLKKATLIFPDYFDAYIALAWCQILQDKKTDAIDSCQQAISVLPDAGEGWGGLALLHALNKEFDAAEKHLNKSNQLEPDNLMGQLAEIMVMYETEPDKARKKFDTLFSQDMRVIKKLFETYLFSQAPNNQVH